MIAPYQRVLDTIGESHVAELAILELKEVFS